MGWKDELDECAKQSLEIFAVDIRDPHGVRTAMKDCDVVVQSSALISIPVPLLARRLQYVDTTFKGTLNVVQAACAMGNDRVAHASTASVCGSAHFEPISEERPLQGKLPTLVSQQERCSPNDTELIPDDRQVGCDSPPFRDLRIAALGARHPKHHQLPGGISLPDRLRAVGSPVDRFLRRAPQSVARHVAPNLRRDDFGADCCRGRRHSRVRVQHKH